jgi:hypothetical protein
MAYRFSLKIRLCRFVFRKLLLPVFKVLSLFGLYLLPVWSNKNYLPDAIFFCDLANRYKKFKYRMILQYLPPEKRREVKKENKFKFFSNRLFILKPNDFF